MPDIFAIAPPAAASQSASPFVAMKPWHRIATVGLMGGCLLWIGLRQSLNPVANSGMGWVLLALAVNIALMLMPVIFYQPGFGWFHPLIFGSFFAFLDHLRRIDVYLLGLQWHAALPGWSADSLTLLLAQDLGLHSVALLAYYAGFFIGPSLRPPVIRFQQPRYLGPKVLATVLFSAGIFAAYMQTRGGIVSHILSWGAGRNASLAGAFYWQFFTQMGQIACLSWLTMDRRSTTKPLFWGCTGLSLTMTFLSGGSRSSVIYFMIMATLAWLLRERKMALTRLVAVALLGLFVMGILGAFRASTFEGEIDWNVLRGVMPGAGTGGESAIGAGLTEVSSRSSVYAGVFPILALVPHQVNFLHGSSYMALLTLPIPRALWPEKPGLIAGMVGETFFNTSVGMPPGAVGEAYWNFGIPGILIVFVLFGVFTRWLADTFAHYTHQPAAIVPYIITLFMLPDPSGLSIIAWLMMLLPTLFFLWAIGAITFQGSRPYLRRF